MADIERRNDGLRAEFSIVNRGRLYDDILMHVENVDLRGCMTTCVQHLKCKAINYNYDQHLCQVCLGERIAGGLSGVDMNGWWSFETPAKGIQYTNYSSF